MAAITKNTPRQTRNMDVTTYDELPVAAGVNIYQGSLVALNSSGNAVTGSDLSTITGVGVAVEQANNTDGSAGDIKVKVFTAGEVALPITNTAAISASFGRKVAVMNNADVDVSGTNVNGVRVGTLMEAHENLSGYAWVRLALSKTTPLGTTE